MTKKLVNTAFIYGMLGIAGGVFYREFTKFNGLDGGTSLAFVHLHLFAMGMLFFLIATLMEQVFQMSQDKRFRWFYIFYNSGLCVAVAVFVLRGILQVQGVVLSKAFDASISGIAGIGHTILTVGLVIYFLILNKRITK